MPELRQIDSTDFAQVFAIHQTSQPNPWSEAVFADCLSVPYFGYQLTHEDTVVGYFLGLAVAPEATLMDIGVHPKLRGRGYGSQLLISFFKQARKRECNELWLEVRESNHAAIGLYQKMGFEKIEVRKGYYPKEKGRENGLIMRAILADSGLADSGTF